MSVAGAAIAIKPDLKFKQKIEKINIGVIGTGLRGQSHVELLLKRNDVNIVAICDVSDVMLQMTKKDLCRK
jgi:predicted dehydrogenase